MNNNETHRQRVRPVIGSTGIWQADNVDKIHQHSAPLAEWLKEFFDEQICPPGLRSPYNTRDIDLTIHDVGCGMGYYAAELYNDSEAFPGGNIRAVGWEGDVPQNPIYKPIDGVHDNLFVGIKQHDITQPFPEEWHKTGSVVCLEVMEHIPEKLTQQTIENVCQLLNYGDYLVTSWAVRGQVGDGHVNCRDNYEAIAMWIDTSKGQLHLLGDRTRSARQAVKDDTECYWFKDTLLVFQYRDSWWQRGT
jgi:tryptophanyl-tRNA synthetase